MSKFLNILSWFFSISLIIISLGAFSKSAVLPGVFIILLGFFLLPPLGKLLHFNLLIKSIVVIILIVLTGISMPKSSAVKNQTPEKANWYKNPPTTQSGNIVEKKWPNGRTWQKYTVDENNKIHGLATFWNEDGEKTVEENYVHGLKEGSSVSFYPDGKKQIVMNYKNDLAEGPAITYDEQGKKVAETIYKNGDKVSSNP